MHPGHLPHPEYDSIFKMMVREDRLLYPYLQEQLPAEITKLIDWDHPIQRESETFIGEDLRQTQADALLAVRLATGEEARLYLLLEQKSLPDRGTPLQLLGYMTRIWQRLLDNAPDKTAPLPPIIPLVVYGGTGTWTVPLSVTEMIAMPEHLKGLGAPLDRYLLHDLHRTDVKELSSDTTLRGVLLCLNARVRDKLTREELIVMAQLYIEVDQNDLNRYIVDCILRKCDVSEDDFRGALQQASASPEETKIAMTSFIEHYEAKGRAEGLSKGRAEGLSKGRAEGLTEGKASMLADQIKSKFGALPVAVQARIEEAQSHQLDDWGRAVLTAETLDAIFGPETRQ